jgi:hypothetical protein
MAWIFALLGLATAIAGGGAIVMGWPLVPLERGWTMVIAGAALASGGLVCLALAALIWETRRTRLAVLRALAFVAAERPAKVEPAIVEPPLVEPPIDEPARLASPSPVKHGPVAPIPAAAALEAGLAPSSPDHRPEHGPTHAAAAPAEPRAEAVVSRADRADAAAPEHEGAMREELQPARSFSVGDTTFIVFTDGSIEARTPKGTQRFESMEEVRDYLEAARA